MIAIRETTVKNVLTKTKVPAGDFVINPYVGCPHKCIYCYAEFMRRFSVHGEAWGDFLDVKICDRAPNAKRLAGKKIIFSSVTDAYNPFEKKYGVTRKLLEAFVDSDAIISILTKSDLLLRDMDLFKRIPNISVGVSLNTLDDSVRKDLEPFAPSIEKRLAAVKALRSEGVRNHIFLSPMFPGLTDFREILDEAKPYTDAFWFENLNLRGAYRARVLSYIREKHSELTPLYEEIYKHKSETYWDALEADIAGYCKKHKIDGINYFHHERIRKK